MAKKEKYSHFSLHAWACNYTLPLRIDGQEEISSTQNETIADVFP